MKHPERVEDYLEHIAQAIERASRYIEPFADAHALRQNEQVQDAVVRNIDIIGEAAARIQKIAPAFVSSHRGVPWIEMRGMRNKMIHEYFDVDWDVVWRTVKNDLPGLKTLIGDLIAERHQMREEPDKS